MPRRRRFLSYLVLTSVLAAGAGAMVWIALSGVFEIPVWAVGLVVAGVFAAIYGGSVLHLRNAVAALDYMAKGLLRGEPISAPRPAGIGEIDDLARSLHQAGRHFHGAQEALRREQGLLEVILEALPGGVLLVERDNHVAYSNSACRQMMGVLSDPTGRLGQRPIRALVRKARHSDEPYEETLTRGYPQRTLGARAFSIGDEGRVLVVVLDLTETRRVETMRRDFVADASHELKTPVTSILTSVEALEMAWDRDPESARLFARQISEAALRLSRLTTDLLDLSRLETGKQKSEPIDLQALVLGEVKPFVRAAQHKDIDFSVETEPVEVSGSPAELGLAIRNLCDNALRYTEEEGKITLSLEKHGGEGVLTVVDTGIGIAGRDLGRVFERFYRVDVARSRQTGGTGLGLAIVKHVAERHGGQVTVNSLLGEGSTFRLRIPFAEGEAASASK